MSSCIWLVDVSLGNWSAAMMTTAEAGLIFHIASYFSFPVLLKVFAGSAFHVPMLPLPDVSTFQCLSLEQRAGVRA